MKKLLLIAITLIITVLSQAQDYSAINAAMSAANALDKEKKRVEAAEAYMNIRRQIETQYNGEPKSTFLMATIKAAKNIYYSKGDYKTGYEITRALLKDQMTEAQQQLLVRYYTRNGAMYASQLADNAKYIEARALVDELTPMADEEVLSFLKTVTAMSYHTEATQHYINGDYNNAYACFEKSAEAFAQKGKDQDVLKALNHMGSCKYFIGEYTAAMQLFDYVYEKATAKGCSDIAAKALTNAGRIFEQMDAKAMAETVIDSLDAIVSKNETFAVMSYKMLAETATNAEDYDIAETYYLKALDLAKQIDTKNVKADVPIIYSCLRDVAHKDCQYAKALRYETLYIEASEARGDVITPYARYGETAYIYFDMRDSVNAIATVNKMTADKRADEIAYATSAVIKNKFGDYEGAMHDIKIADAKLAKMYDENTADRMIFRSLRASILLNSGQAAEAVKEFTKYYEWTKANYGSRSIKTCNAEFYVANAEAFAGNVERGKKLYIDAVKTYTDVVAENLKSTPADERKAYWESLSSMLFEMTAFGIKSETQVDAFTQTAYDALLYSKSLLLASEKSMRDVMQRNGSQQDMKDYEMLENLQSQIAELSKRYSRNKDKIAQLYEQKRTLDRQLSQRSKSYSDYLSFLEIKYNDIKSALSDNEVVIDFTDYVRDNGEHVYAAYIIRKTDDNPLLLRAFSEQQIDSLLQGRKKQKLYSDELSAKAVDIIWQPFQEFITDGTTVYYVPSGIIHQIAIESLPLNGQTLLGDKYNFVRLSSAREIFNKNDAMLVASQNNATLLGGLLYDIDDETMTAESRKYEILPSLATLGRNRGSSNQSQFAYLKNSKDEVEEIANILKNSNVNVTLLTGSEGTEEAFLAMHDNAPTTLLISTHGFYYSKDNAANVSFLRGYNDAMARSGLILAGGNKAWRGQPLPEGVQSGILTAAKISRMNLEGNEIVVLSACQTAQGETTSDGVYGLQRAFKKAGTKTIIMTLWSVNDLSTKEFVTTFFQRLTTNGWHKHEAFEYAKRIIRNKYKDPTHWAAFVMMD